MQKDGKKVIKIVLLALMWLIVAILIAFSFCQLFFPKFCFDTFGIRFYLISYTGSMEPDLQFNDLIAVVKADFFSCQVGDIITFESKTPNQQQSITVTHEVVDIFFDNEGTRYLKTKGTNLPFADVVPTTVDGAFGTNVFVGKYVWKSGFLGNMLAFSKSTVGIVSLVTTVVGILAICFVFAKVRHSHH